MYVIDKKRTLGKFNEEEKRAEWRKVKKYMNENFLSEIEA